jgi:hypothetical protein
MSVRNAAAKIEKGPSNKKNIWASYNRSTNRNALSLSTRHLSRFFIKDARNTAFLS